MPRHTACRLLACLALLLSIFLLQPAETAGATTPRLIVYHGFGKSMWRAETHLGQLRGTSRAFRRFVRARQNHLWVQAGRRSRCAHAALVMVKEYRTDGFARISDEGMFQHRGPVSCADGGAEAIWALSGGRWRELAMAQSPGYDCRMLNHYRVPSSIAGHQCDDEYGNLVPYSRS